MLKEIISGDGKVQIKTDANSTIQYPKIQYGVTSLTHNPIVYILSIDKCVNSSQIDNYIYHKFFSFKFVDNYLDVSDYNKPVVKYVNTIQGALDATHTNFNYLNYLTVNISTQDGLVFDSISQIKTFKFDYRTETNSQSINSTQLSNIYFLLQNMCQLNKRSYIKAQDVLANIGGIANFFVICGIILNYLSNKFHTVIDGFAFLSKNVEFDLDKEESSNGTSKKLVHFTRIELRSNRKKLHNKVNSEDIGTISRPLDTVDSLKDKDKEEEEKDTLVDFLKNISCWRFYLNKSNPRLKMLDDSRKLIELFLEKDNIFKLYLEIIRLKKFMLDSN